MKKIILMIFALSIAMPVVAVAKDFKIVEFEWDANVEPGTEYKIYYGKKSRFDPALDVEKIYQEVRDKYCISIEDPTERAACEKSVDDFCVSEGAPENDKLCDFDFFIYSNPIAVGSALGWAYKSYADEMLFFTIVAVDENESESLFANEIKVKIDNSIPEGVLNFTGAMKDNVSYEVIIKRTEEIK